MRSVCPALGLFSTDPPPSHSQVNQLFIALWELGYRVISKDVNGGDPACSEFVVARLGEEAPPTSGLRGRIGAKWEPVGWTQDSC